MLRLTVLEIVASVTCEAVSTEAGRGSGTDRSELEAESKAEMPSLVKRGGDNFSHVSCLAGEKLELGHLSLDLECLVPERLGVNELLLVQDVSGGGHGEAEAAAKDDQVLHCVSVSCAELMTAVHSRCRRSDDERWPCLRKHDTTAWVSCHPGHPHRDHDQHSPRGLPEILLSLEESVQFNMALY